MMKKRIVPLLILLLLSALACRLPFLGQTEAAPSPAPVEATAVPPAENTPVPQIQEPGPTVTATDAAPPEGEEQASGTITLEDNGVAITVPGTYRLGDVESDLEILVEGLQTLSEEDAQDIETLYETYQDDIMLWGYDTASPAMHQTSLLILKNEEFAGMSLPMIMSFANLLLGEEVDSMQQELLTLGDRETARFLTRAETGGVSTAQAIYLFNDSGKLWIIGFFTNQEQLESRLPDFDAAVASFRVLPTE
jgi:hypothetical protein